MKKNNNFYHTFYGLGDSIAVQLDVHCRVILEKTNELEPSIRVSGDPNKTIKTKQDEDTISITQEGELNSGFSINGGSFSVGGSNSINIGRVTGNFSTGNFSSNTGEIHISGPGAVYVNGKRVDDGGGATHEEMVLWVYLPARSDVELEAKLSGSSQLTSSADILLRSAYIDAVGSSIVRDIVAGSIEAHIAGSGDIHGTIIGGSLDVSCSGSGEVVIFGTFRNVRLNISGSGDVTTHGDCAGDYRVSASGCASVYHDGKVRGKSRKSVSGVATIRGI